MLEVKGLGYAYGKREVISEIDFTVKPGEFVCLLGANGSGKTTILKCINKILKPTRGKVLVDSFDLAGLKQREVARLISTVPQEHEIVFSFQAIDVVTMGVTPYLTFGSMPGEETYQQAEEVMNQLGIFGLAARRYNQLSGGERQLVLIARSLMQRAKFLVLDEPTAHLDFKNKYLMLKEIKNLTVKGMSVIAALHDPNLALKFCDRAVIIRKGRVQDEGRGEEVINEANLKEAYGLELIVSDTAGRVDIALENI